MIPKNKQEKKKRKHAPAETSAAHEVSHTEKTLEAVGEDKEVVKLNDDQCKSAEKKSLSACCVSFPENPCDSVGHFIAFVDLTCVV